MDDRFSVEFEMTDDLAARIARAVLTDRGHYLRLSQGIGLPLLLLTVLLFWPTVLVLREHLSPVGLLAVFLGVCVGYLFLLRLLVYRYTCWGILLPFYGQTRTVRMTFSDEHIFMETGELSGERKWKEIDEIRVLPHLWLFRLEPGGHFAVPTEVLSAELQALIRRKVHEEGKDLHE
jgi:hypothetical protein